MSPRSVKELTMDTEKGKGGIGISGTSTGDVIADSEGVFFASLSSANSSSNNSSNSNVFVSVNGSAVVRIWTNVLMGFMVVASVVSNARAVSYSIARKYYYNRSGNSSSNAKDNDDSPLNSASTSSDSSSSCNTLSQSPLVRAATSVAILLVTPFVIWDGFPNPDLFSILKHVELVWSALLHCSMWPVALTAFVAGMLHGLAVISFSSGSSSNSSASSSPMSSYRPMWRSVFSVVILFTVLIVVLSQLQVVTPSWAWNPFVWFKFPIFMPSGIAQAMQGLCVEKEAYYKNPQMPLCLSHRSWDVLSSGVLSSRNHQDVATVLKGVDYARQHKIVIAVMSRDTVEAIAPLRQNVEGFSPFFQDLAVVVFENDSKDGSREAFKSWSSEAKGYSVDLMTCGPDNLDCKFGMSHRYDSTEYKDYFKSSAIGKMAEFRQKIVDYISNDDKYAGFSHMVVVDIDLKVSFSPLGLIHSLGLDLAEEYAIASTGRQTWPGSFGTLTPQYDFSAFRALETPANKRLHEYHRMFCGIMPPGDRWRNQCDAISPMHLFLVMNHEWQGRDAAYPVESAFNGATIYPMSAIREQHAKYDAGDDLQRCEHIGFNKSLKRHMYVNPKWDFHLMPTNPGGPTGIRALKNVFRIVFVPRLSLVIFFQNIIFMSMFVYSLVTLGVFTVLFVSTSTLLANNNTKKRRQQHVNHRRGDSGDNNATTSSLVLPLTMNNNSVVSKEL